MRKLLILILCILSLTGCTVNTLSTSAKSDANKPDATAPMGIIINQSDTEKINLPNESDILFFDDKQIIYSIEEWDKSNEYLNIQFYKYTIAEDTSVKLLDLTEYKLITGRISIIDDKLYIPCLLMDNKNKIFEVNLSTGNFKIFHEWIGNTFICNTYTDNNTLFVFEIIPTDDASSESGTNYKVTAFNLQNSSQKEIMSGKYQNGTGDVISCITVNDSVMYLYTLKYDNYKESTHILTYNISSEKFAELTQISSKLSKIGDDPVMDMYALGNNLIFHTLNGQILVEQIQTNKDLVPLKIPDELGSDISSRYTVLDSLVNTDDYLYFATTNSQEKTIFKFDNTKQAFVPIKFDFNQDKLNILNHYFTNKTGDIIMKSKNDSNAEVTFLLVKKELLKK
ncbi:hypothetical protein [Anaerotignum sp.]|uniref:hypothetical protein n=1 Tax=Anaerotignum sp. TaxID=2039241 RepID=UPI00289CACA4|nr:hypothetical protein [Anaerotignum sp.]